MPPVAVYVTTAAKVAAGAYTLHSLAFHPRMQFTGVVQLTDPGALKEGLVSAAAAQSLNAVKIVAFARNLPGQF